MGLVLVLPTGLVSCLGVFFFLVLYFVFVFFVRILCFVVLVLVMVMVMVSVLGLGLVLCWLGYSKLVGWLVRWLVVGGSLLSIYLSIYYEVRGRLVDV